MYQKMDDCGSENGLLNIRYVLANYISTEIVFRFDTVHICHCKLTDMTAM